MATNDPWSGAVPVSRMLSQSEPELAFLVPRFLARGSLTFWFSPRGLGKTLLAYGIALQAARDGLRVLLVDRDNSPSEVRRRMAQWHAGDVESLEVLNRRDAPKLTDRAKWREFPVDRYDVVIVDSLNASTEGVGDNDSGEASQAIATLLDVVREREGPAILVLGNTIKSGAHSRGSGVIEDRADIVYEVRDATQFAPAGTKAWWEELPAAGAGDFGLRAKRRKQRGSYRLAFIPTKFRVGPEPDPFIYELRLDSEPWEFEDVTNQVVEASGAAMEVATRAGQRRTQDAAAALRLEVARRSQDDPMLADRDAVEFLTRRGLSRDSARDLIKVLCRTHLVAERRLKEPGRPHVLLPRPIVSDAQGGGIEADESQRQYSSESTRDSAERDSCGSRDPSPPAPAVDAATSGSGFPPMLSPNAGLPRNCPHCGSNRFLHWEMSRTSTCLGCRRAVPEKMQPTGEFDSPDSNLPESPPDRVGDGGAHA